MSKPITEFIEKYYLHFNAAALVDASKGYVAHLKDGGKMMITLAGAMSTAELGKILAEMIRQDKVDFISCTGANLEEDLMNLVAHSHSIGESPATQRNEDIQLLESYVQACFQIAKLEKSHL